MYNSLLWSSHIRKIPAEFPIGSVSFINLVLANATSHTQTRCGALKKNETNEKNT